MGRLKDIISEIQEAVETEVYQIVVNYKEGDDINFIAMLMKLARDKYNGEYGRLLGEVLYVAYNTGHMISSKRILVEYLRIGYAYRDYIDLRKVKPQPDMLVVRTSTKPIKIVRGVFIKTIEKLGLVKTLKVYTRYMIIQEFTKVAPVDLDKWLEMHEFIPSKSELLEEGVVSESDLSLTPADVVRVMEEESGL